MIQTKKKGTVVKSTSGSAKVFPCPDEWLWFRLEQVWCASVFKNVYINFASFPEATKLDNLLF